MATSLHSCRRSAADNVVFSLTPEPIHPGALDGVAGSGDGGIAVFYGIVRDRSHDGSAVSSLWYEAHEAMAIREFEAIAAEARERFGDVRLAIVHRVGEVRAGDISVAVLAAAPHRGPAFDACRYAIDQLKRRAAIWKQERRSDGTAEWRAGA